jgi:hypothetical protein
VAESFPVFPRTVVNRDENLESVHRHIAVAVHADLAKGNAAGDVEVGREIPGDHAAMLAGRGVNETELREVESGTGCK